MLNLILTRTCNRKCSYCFALDLTGKNVSAPLHIDRDTFDKALDLADRSRAAEIRILGGEPTLHPDFIEYVTSALNRGLAVKIFTNGLIPKQVVTFLSGCDDHQIHFLVNVNQESTYTGRQWQTLCQNLELLGSKVTCGFNIFEPEFDAEHCLTLIRKFGLYPGLRLGLAHPTLSGENTYLDWKDAPFAARRIIELARKADAQDTIVGFDCGFSLCMFEGFFDELISLRIDFRFTCRPVLDLTPDGRLWHCLALWGYEGVGLERCQDVESYREYFRQKLEIYHNFGVTENCLDCKYRRTGQCSGGCVVRNMRQWR